VGKLPNSIDGLTKMISRFTHNGFGIEAINLFKDEITKF